MDRTNNVWTRLDSDLTWLIESTLETITAMNAGEMKATPKEIEFMQWQEKRLTQAYKLIHGKRYVKRAR